MELLKDMKKGKGKGAETKNPFENLQKAMVLQESRCFNDSNINAKKCCDLLAKIIYLINQVPSSLLKGEKFTENESNTLFFSITKLFQSDVTELRRMIYLIVKVVEFVMKEMRHESAIYIITSCLIKDLNSNKNVFRINALRTLSLILDSSNLIQIERYIKSALTDKDHSIADAALVAAIHLYDSNKEIVKKWSNEVSEKLKPGFENCPFHSLILLYEIKKADLAWFKKILFVMAKENHKQLANLQIIRFVKQILNKEEIDSTTEKALLDFLNREVLSSEDMVVIEACRALCELKNISNQELSNAVSSLSVFLLSSSSVNKFAALKILNKFISNPTRASLLSNTSEVEALISDNNRSLSCMAISILLKICKESQVDKLLNQIFEYISEISDEFKIDIIISLNTLYRKLPSKHKNILKFLSDCLKAEGSVEFKKKTLEVIEHIVHEIPDSRDHVLMNLMEFIEDCDYPELHFMILNLFNKEMANSNDPPKKFIRFIINRVFLEKGDIRACAISSLGKTALKFPSLRDDIRPVLERALKDEDDEVKSRANYYMEAIFNEETRKAIDRLNSFQLSKADFSRMKRFVQV